MWRGYCIIIMICSYWWLPANRFNFVRWRWCRLGWNRTQSIVFFMLLSILLDIWIIGLNKAKMQHHDNDIPKQLTDPKRNKTVFLLTCTKNMAKCVYNLRQLKMWLWAVLLLCINTRWLQDSKFSLARFSFDCSNSVTPCIFYELIVLN